MRELRLQRGTDVGKLLSVWHLLRDSGSAWLDHNATRLAAAVAFYSILSLAPLVILSLAIAGMIFGEEAARGELDTQMRSLVGDAGADVLKETLAHAKKPEQGILATVMGAVTLLFGAAGVFGELHDALNVIWEVRPKKGRGIWGFLRDKFLSFGMVLSIGFLLLISLVLSTALAFLGKYTAGLAPGVPILMQALNFILSLLLIAGLFGLLFRYLPDARIPWRHVWFGAAVTAALFTLGKFAIGMYIAKAAVGSPFGAAGSLVVFVVWAYYSALIVFFGAELTQAHARAAGVTVEPISTAERVPAEDAKPGAKESGRG
jgi:membrane protein